MYEYEYTDTNGCLFFIIKSPCPYRINIVKDSNISKGIMNNGGCLYSIDLFPEDNKCKLSLNDSLKIKSTVLTCLTNFLTEKPKSLIYFIPSGVGIKQEARQRKFQMWHSSMNDNLFDFTPVKIDLGDFKLMSVFMQCKNNLKEDEIINSLKDILYNDNFNK